MAPGRIMKNIKPGSFHLAFVLFFRCGIIALDIEVEATLGTEKLLC